MKKLSRIFDNLALFSFNCIATGLCFYWFTPSKIGADSLFSILAIIVFFDLVAYAIHFGFHKIPWLSKFHHVHHSDTEVDFSTTFREHFVQTILTVGVFAGIIHFFSIPARAITLYVYISFTLSFLSHTTLPIPSFIEKMLGFLLITPRFHRKHHEYGTGFYGGMFIFWDYLFGTAKAWAGSCSSPLVLDESGSKLRWLWLPALFLVFYLGFRLVQRIRK